MATVVLQVVGAAIGGAIGGPAGAAIGRAVGAAAGYAIDQQLFSKDQVIKGGRLDHSRFLSSTEGLPIPKVYGRVKTGGQLIWATRFEERRKRKKRGGKGGGPSVTTESYSYFANFAVGICEGPISRVGRIWADGEEIDQTRVTIRIYNGSEDQEPDPLIEALQGQHRTPAFRGTAYAVFEDLPLADFGNRIPQITFEVIRSVAAVDRQVRAVTLIPGAGEFAYSPVERRSGKKGRAVSENRHVRTASSDWHASLDELQALCPNLERVSLVVAWFGTDLRAGECKVEPRCVHDDLSRSRWEVCGLDRSSANLVSTVDGKPAYGGTPSDQAVIDAILDFKARGLKVSLYPFLMMDIPTDNALPDPDGSTTQSAYPWRGRITCHPAIGQPGTADQTLLASQQISAFVGTTTPADFSYTSGQINYLGSAELSYRRMILHYASLCNAAGGVERFFIGSEMRSLTRVRDENGAFPFVSALVDLATDVKSLLVHPTQVSYASDWSEYFGYHPQDGSNDLCFNLDTLWSSTAIDAVSIDNYMPISDWKESGDPGDPYAASRHSIAYLKSNIANGEGVDWYYATLEDRLEGNRTPITDGQGEPWVWSFKALRQWWLNPHHERKNGVRNAQPTSWVPQSKPVWFSEIGCAAVDRGANQPNVFIDAKSVESGLPFHSRGGRDDLMQLRYLQAVIAYWQDADITENPVSSIYSGRMVEPENIYPWAWDARPFPAFPQLVESWSDGINWYRGHWLNGRLGSCPLDDLLSQILIDHGFEEPLVQADGHLDGYLLGAEISPRQALEPLVAAFNLAVSNHGSQLMLSEKNYTSNIVITHNDLVQEDDTPAVVRTRTGEGELARQINLSHGEIDSEFDVTTSVSRRLETDSQRQHSMDLPAVMGRQAAISLMNARLQDHWIGRESVALSVSQKHLKVEPGDVLSLPDLHDYRVLSLATGIDRKIEAVRVRKFDEALPWKEPRIAIDQELDVVGSPYVLAMNLPLKLNEIDPAPQLYFATFAEPWRTPLAIFSSVFDSGFEQAGAVAEPSIMFELVTPLDPGPLARWDNANSLHIRTFSNSDEFSSLDDLSIYAGSNVIAVKTNSGEFEILQFSKAEMLAPQEWRLSGLLRGQMGTIDAMLSGSGVGSLGVVLDDSITPIPVARALTGLERNWRIGPSNQPYTSTDYAALTAACNHLSKRPLRPAHLTREFASDDVEIGWIRQTRVDGDDWSGVEVPLDFSQERYRISIFASDGSRLREWESTSAHTTYLANDRRSDLGDLVSPFSIGVSQLDDRGVPGPESNLAITP